MVHVKYKIGTGVLTHFVVVLNSEVYSGLSYLETDENC